LLGRDAAIEAELRRPIPRELRQAENGADRATPEAVRNKPQRIAQPAGDSKAEGARARRIGAGPCPVNPRSRMMPDRRRRGVLRPLAGAFDVEPRLSRTSAGKASIVRDADRDFAALGLLPRRDPAAVDRQNARRMSRLGSSGIRQQIVRIATLERYPPRLCGGLTSANRCVAIGTTGAFRFVRSGAARCAGRGNNPHQPLNSRP